jgi:tetratricopeptide (TPR) repeat protein
LSIGRYDSASFCLEEVILHDPMNHMLHCRLAEVYFTMGSVHFLTARKYFSQSLEIKKKNNPRALHGLAATCHAIAEDLTLTSQLKGRADVNRALHEFAKAELASVYRASKSELGAALDNLLQLQSATVNSSA